MIRAMGLEVRQPKSSAWGRSRAVFQVEYSQSETLSAELNAIGRSLSEIGASSKE
jgi:hypothetical protein